MLRTSVTISARECAVLRDALASECHLESINVNVQRNQFGQQRDGLNVNGNVGFRIVPK
jgi:glutamine amidotransferase PdxT